MPDEGAVAIYFGPHIGITKDGAVGENHRRGQTRTTSCCGAAKGALGKLSRDQIVDGRVSELDHQMNTLEQILFKQRARILAAELPLKEATEVIYEAIDQRIEELVALTKYSCKYVILFGAITSTATPTWAPTRHPSASPSSTSRPARRPSAWTS